MSIEMIRSEIIKYAELIFKGEFDHADAQLERVMLLIKEHQQDTIIALLKDHIKTLENK